MNVAGEAIGVVFIFSTAKAGRTGSAPRPDPPMRNRLTASAGYCKSFRTAWGAELACAMAAIDACCSTCALVRLAASAATSASRMRDSAAE